MTNNNNRILLLYTSKKQNRILNFYGIDKKIKNKNF